MGFKYLLVAFLAISLNLNLASSFVVDFTPQSIINLQKNSNGGGTQCAACAIVVTLLEELTVIHDKSIEQVLDEICGYFPKEFTAICTYFVNNYGQEVIELVEQNLGADDVCLNLEFCTDPTCRIVPNAEESPLLFRAKSVGTVPKIFKQKARNAINGIQESPWDWITQLFNRLAQKHDPIEDIDSDDFSLTDTMRGTYWRGRDCDDFDANIHPGRTEGGDPNQDWNCNGISGTDSKGNSYEDMLCGNSQPLGTIVLGDSGGAHFSVPPSYLNASEINGDTYDDLLDVLLTEFDWPQRSGYTGYEPNATGIMIDSIYKRMWSRNHCNHRDYQNLGVNGCRSGPMASNVILSLARNQTIDNPALVFFELIGNDVCFGEHDLTRMTTPAQFEINVLQSLNYLDEHLPKGSHVVFIGLADGRVLWNQLHNRTHPIGITYETVYNYLNCLQISPCWVWMNDNETIRNAGSARAAELSAVYNQIIANYTFKNFDMAYYDFPFPAINALWEQRGGQTWELIEPVDGFHPNQIAHALMSEFLWGQLEEQHPTFIGQVNPNNAKIESLFGDQGGY